MFHLLEVVGMHVQEVHDEVGRKPCIFNSAGAHSLHLPQVVIVDTEPYFIRHGVVLDGVEAHRPHLISWCPR